MGAWKKSRGVALLTAMFFGLLCFALATGFLLRVPVDLAATKELELKTKGAYIAEAAVQDTMAWMSHELSNGREPTHSASPNPTRTGSLGEWTWNCQIEPDAGTPPNDLTSLRIYKLTATATLDGVDHYRIITDVQAGQSFARFSVFIDEDGFITYDFLVTEDSLVEGPIHKNRPISFLVRQSLLNRATPPTPKPFNSLVTTTAGTHEWHSSGGTTSSLTDEQYDNIFANGAADLHYGVAPRVMPSDSVVLASAAWGGVPPASPPTPVTVNPMGGLYIQGNVTDMTMDVTATGDFRLTLRQGTQTWVYVEDTTNDQRLLTNPSGTTVTTPGIGTGVLFATGNIEALKGKNKGAHTIANRFETGQTLEISGSITRADTPVGSQPTSNDDRLGIVSSTIWIADESVLPRNVSNPLSIYATVMATDIFEVKDRKTGNPGAMAIYGGMISKRAWATVDFNNLTDLRTTAGYGSLSGYGSANIFYDKLLANEPPPEYPTTAAAELKVRSWREQSL